MLNNISPFVLFIFLKFKIICQRLKKKLRNILCLRSKPKSLYIKNVLILYQIFRATPGLKCSRYWRISTFKKYLTACYMAWTFTHPDVSTKRRSANLDNVVKKIGCFSTLFPLSWMSRPQGPLTSHSRAWVLKVRPTGQSWPPSYLIWPEKWFPRFDIKRYFDVNWVNLICIIIILPPLIPTFDQ